MPLFELGQSFREHLISVTEQRLGISLAFGLLIKIVVNIVNGLNQAVFGQLASVGCQPKRRSPVFRDEDGVGNLEAISITPRPATRMVPLADTIGDND